jgi:hypothetical protein
VTTPILVAPAMLAEALDEPAGELPITPFAVLAALRER